MGSNCHSHGLANGGTVYFQASPSCGAPELEAANLPAVNKRDSLQRVRAAAIPGAIGVIAEDNSSASARKYAPVDAELESPPHSCYAISSVVLRI
jgi:hypothetical protein